MSGKLLKSIASAANLTKINIEGIAKGIYFIKVTDDKTVITQRVII